MELRKVVDMDLSADPISVPVSNKSIEFYNLDKNTARFQFRLTNKGHKLLISDENVKGYAFCASDNGSTSGVINLEIIDPMEGIVAFTVPPFFLKSATNTYCIAQLYLSLNDAGAKGKDDTVVIGRVGFSVADAIINKIESDVKVSYIRMFDDLKMYIEGKVAEMEKDIGKIEDAVKGVQVAGDEAVAKINKASADGLNGVTQASAKGLTDIENARTNALYDVETAGNNATGAIENATNDFNQNAINKTGDFNTNATEKTQIVDDKIKELEDNLAKNNFVTNEQFEEKTTALPWQKYKLTNDDGSYQQVTIGGDVEKLHALAPGNYYATSVPIENNATSKAGFLNVEVGRSDVKRINFRPYNSKQVFVKRYYQEWGEWERVDQYESDTGWVPFMLINGANSNTAFTKEGDNGFVCAYRMYKQNNITNVCVRLNGSKIEYGQVIAQLPKGLVPNAQSFYMRVPTDMGVGIITIRPSGEVSFFTQKQFQEEWKSDESRYVYGQFEFTV